MARGNSDDLALRLRTRIAEGTWADGGRMPTERALAEEFSVARNTVRRALDRLEQDGAVIRHVGRGTYVRPAEAPGSLHAIVERMQQSSPADMIELRLLLEPAAAAFAATNASGSDLADIRAANARAAAAAEMPEFEHWDTELHRLIFSCTRNALLHEIHEILRVLRHQDPWFEMKQRSFSEERRQVYCVQHESIVSALERRLPGDARAAMHTHLVSVRENMLGR